MPYKFAGLFVDVRIIGSEFTILADGEVIATHRQGVRRHSYVTDTEHAPAKYDRMQGLWTRAYFLRQAAKVGPGCVAALTRLLDHKVIEAQGFRSCMNILDLGKRGSRPLLEQACQQLIDSDPHRPISYTAVKHHLTAIRAEHNQRPTTNSGTPLPAEPAAGPGSPSTPRDTSGAHLAGAEAFSLDALARPPRPGHSDNAKGAGHA